MELVSVDSHSSERVLLHKKCRSCGAENLRMIGPCLKLSQAGMKLFPDGQVSENVWGSLYQCKVCGLGMRIPCLTEEQLVDLYKGMESGKMDYDFDTNSAWVSARKALLRNWDESDEPLILDIGAYEGRFLQGLPARWQKNAIEPSLYAQNILHSKGIRVISDSLVNVASDLYARFDAVCMFDIFEHLPDPKLGMITALRYLKHGGRLFVSTGNIEAWPWKWLGSEHWYLQFPQHVSFGSRRFFNWFGKEALVNHIYVQDISHRYGCIRERINDTIITIYFGLRKRGGFCRMVQRLIQSMPVWRQLMHKDIMPCTFVLKDHLFVEMVYAPVNDHF